MFISLYDDLWRDNNDMNVGYSYILQTVANIFYFFLVIVLMVDMCCPCEPCCSKDGDSKGPEPVPAYKVEDVLVIE